MTSLAPALQPAVDERSSVSRAMTLLGHFESGATLGISELARRSGLPKSTVFRLLGTLEQAEILVRCTGGYRVGDRLIDLGRAALNKRSDSLIMRARPYLARLFCAVPGSVELIVMRGPDVRILDVITHPRVESVTLSPGDIVPGGRSSAGRTINAVSSMGSAHARATHGALPSTGAQATAGALITTNEDVLGGRIAISAAVTQYDLRDAAITVVLPAGTSTIELDRVAGHVSQCAHQLTRSLRMPAARPRTLQTVGNS